MMSAFKAGDRVYLFGDSRVRVVSRVDVYLSGTEKPFATSLITHAREATPTPPPAPKVEPVPEDARVGDVYGLAPEHGRGEHTVKVIEVRPYNEYRVETLSGEVPGGWYTHATHARMNWHLITRGPAPVPAPEAKREDESDEAMVARLHRDGLAAMRKAQGLPVEEVRTRLRPASPPEPATMTAGELACRAFVDAVETPRGEMIPFAALPANVRRAWEAAALAAQPGMHDATPGTRIAFAAGVDAALSAQPATEAKAREVVGYYLRDKASHKSNWFSSHDGQTSWVSPRGEPVDIHTAKAEREVLRAANPAYTKPGRLVLVRVTRTRRGTR